MKNKIHHFQELSDEALERVTGGVGGPDTSDCVSNSEYNGKCPSGYMPSDSQGICCRVDGPTPQTREHTLL